MEIIVGTPQNATTKFKGDLLEDLAGKLLKAHNYEIVHKELRKTGCELDLVCRDEANHSKVIYVECKAYDPNNKIQSEVIVRLRGLRGMDGYGEEMWLVTTSALGKDAQGLVDQISNGSEARHYTFITPEKLIGALIRASVIKSYEVSNNEIASLVPQKRKLDEPLLLVTDFGYFWCYRYKPQGEIKGYIFFDADSTEIITDAPLLNKFAELTQLDRDLDFSIVLSLLDDEGASRLTADKLSLKQSYISKIDTMKFRINHPGKDELKNSDVFVYPDLEDSVDDKKKKANAQTLLSSKGQVKSIIFGDDLSGKTTLLQRYQMQLIGSGQIPLLIGANEIHVKTIGAFNKLLLKRFKSQYSNSPEYLRFFQNVLDYEPEKITILIDDLQDIGIKRNRDQFELLRDVVFRYPSIIITAHKASELEILTKSEWRETFNAFPQYNLLQFGHLKRDQLIDKWLLASNQDLSDTQIHNSKRALASKINIAVGKSFIPTYPFYLLTMLQLLESGTQNSIKGTAYGELYAYLITNALGTAGANSEELDFYNTYLSNLAFKLFESNVDNIDSIELERFYADYVEKMYIGKDFSQVHRLLARSKILLEKSGRYSFQFNYIAYYFVAKYLSDNYSSKTVQAQIHTLVENLYKERYANIVIFLIHHSKNNELINAILDEAKSLFSEVSVNMLSTAELSKFNALLTEQVSPTFKDIDPAENRKKELTFRDEADNTKSVADEEINEKLDLFGKIQYSFKIMEVLGQIANNYYGSLDGPTKTEILQALYELGLRSMNALLQEHEAYIDGLREEVRKAIAEEKTKTANVDKLANEVVYSFTQLIVFLFIRKTSDSIMSKNLFPTVDRLVFAEDHYAKHLITAAIKLNFPDELDSVKESVLTLFEKLEKNFLPRDVLRFLVLDHFYKYNVSHSLKLSVCTNLGIKLVPPTTKLLS